MVIASVLAAISKQMHGFRLCWLRTRHTGDMDILVSGQSVPELTFVDIIKRILGKWLGTCLIIYFYV